MNINILWNHGNSDDWKKALNEYYANVFVSKHMDLEKRMEELNPEEIRNMNAEQFYSFLYNEYFVWKYTAPNRLATTRKSLSNYKNEGMKLLESIQKQIFSVYDNDPFNTAAMLEAAKQVYGLGTAGASGLLAIMFPERYGTVDQFLLYSLLKVNGLAEHEKLEKMIPTSLKVKDGVLLIDILRRKASELNKTFGTNEWTPRKIDMVLWAVDRD